MRRKLPSITVCVVLVFTMLVSVDMGVEVVENVRGTTIYVPTDYPTIQEAIDAANPGDTVFVYGIPHDPYPIPYYERLFIDKRINLIGEDRETTIIMGDANGRYGNPTIDIYSDGVTISGFTLCYGGAGIVTYGRNTEISGNILYNNIDAGIYLMSSNNIVSNNIISDSRTGILLGNSGDNDITGNFMSGCGIFIWGTQPDWTNNNIDTTNTVNGRPVYYWVNRNGGTIPNGAGQVILANSHNVNILNQALNDATMGIALWVSSNNNIVGNQVSNNWYGMNIWYSNENNIMENTANSCSYGISLTQSHRNNITDNTISSNPIEGIYLVSSNENNIIGNYISNNGHFPLPGEQYEDAGVTLTGSSGNKIYYNEFIDNIIQAHDDRSDNFWDNGYPFGGNYWSEAWDYSCIDEYKGPNQNIPGSDGLGDNPFYIDSNSRDNYPLKEPYNPNLPPMANAGSDQLGYIRKAVQFNGSNSIDPEGGTLDYYWDFEDGSPITLGVNPIHIFDTPGIYNVTLIVLDDTRNSGSDICTINVKPSPDGYLEKGWNLISLPTIQSNTNIRTVLQSIEGDYDIVQYYNVSTNNNHWKNYLVSKPNYMNDLQDLNHKMGFWIHVTNPNGTILLPNGEKPVNSEYVQLFSGWNLVGYPSITDRIRKDALNNLKFGTDIDAIWTFDAISQKWEEIGENDYFVPGKGYWIHTKRNCEWLAFLPNSPILNLNKNIYYPTIQLAIDNANPYDAIEISPGTFNEELTISKPITLHGKNPQTTVIESLNNPIIEITSGDVVINNFTLIGGNHGIYITNSNNIFINDNIIKDYRITGIIAYDSSTVILNNQISNDPSKTGGAGIKLTRCFNSIIEDNTVENIVYSMYLMYSTATIRNNMISPTDGYDDRLDSIGIALYLDSNAMVQNNVIVGGDVGIGVEYGSSPIIEGNIINRSEYYGILIKNFGSPTLNNNEIRNCGLFAIFSNQGRSLTVSNNIIHSNDMLFCNSTINYLRVAGGSDTNAITVNTSIAEYQIDYWQGLTIQWYLHVKVVNLVGDPIQGAIVEINDNHNGSFTGTYTTSSDGYVKFILVTEFWENNSEKMYYTPYNITASIESKIGYEDPEPWLDSSMEVVVVVDYP